MRDVARVTRSRDSARRSYDRWSRWYDLLAEAGERRFRDMALALLDPRPGETALELGVGTGRALTTLATAVGPEGSVHGIDISPRMLEVAGRRVRRAGLADRVHLVVGDASALPYPDGCMGAAFMSFTLELFDTPEIPTVLAECRRVLRPGGRLAVVSLAKTSATATRVYEWLHERLPALLDCRPIFLADAVSRAGFDLLTTRTATDWGLGIEVVLATPGHGGDAQASGGPTALPGQERPRAQPHAPPRGRAEAGPQTGPNTGGPQRPDHDPGPSDRS